MVKKKIGAIILAAGKATRFGSDKLTALFNGKPLIHLALTTAALSSADPITLVVRPGTLGRYQQIVRTTSRKIKTVVAERGPSGMAYSLRAGLNSMPENVAGVLVLLGDMPLVNSSLVDALIESYALNDYAVVPTYQSRWGNPVLLSLAAALDAQTLTGDAGARLLLQTNAKRVRLIAWDKRCLVDVDTQHDLLDLEICAGRVTKKRR